MSIDPDAIGSNPSDNPEFADILAARLTRRGVLGGGLGAAAIGFLGGSVGDGRDGRCGVHTAGGAAQARLHAHPDQFGGRLLCPRGLRR